MCMMPCAMQVSEIVSLLEPKEQYMAWRKASYACVFLVTPILWHIHVLLEGI